MHRITPFVSHIRALAILTLALLLLVVAGPVAASPALPALASVTPWSARCYTDTCVGFSVTFDGGHTVALGHAGDNPDYWVIFDSDRLTVDEAAFAEASVDALARRDVTAVVAAYPELPAWYLDALAAYVVPGLPVYQRWLPLIMR